MLTRQHYDIETVCQRVLDAIVCCIILQRRANREKLDAPVTLASQSVTLR